MIGHRFIASEPVRNLFYPHTVIFEIPRQCYNKTNCVVRRGCFNRVLSVVTPVQYYNFMVKDTSKFLRILKTHHSNSKKIETCNTWFKTALNKHPKLRRNKTRESILWKPYKHGSSHKSNNYFLSSHSNFKQFYIQFKILSRNQRLCNENYLCTIIWKFVHDFFWAKTHVSTNKRKIINIFQIHWWYIFNLERNKEWTWSFP